MGFSTIGLVVAVVMLTPSVALWVRPPREPLPAASVPAPLSWLEYAGQALCVAIVVLVPPGEIVAPWMVPALATVAGYYALWARYVVRERAEVWLYASWWIVPVPMAVLPVLTFLSVAAWLASPWLAVSALILAAGHIPSSSLRARAAHPPLDENDAAS